MVHSEDLNNKLTGITDGTTNTWLGGIRTGPAALENSQWTWIDGTPMIYDNWHTGQPDNLNGIQFCLYTNFEEPGLWDDFDCTGTETGTTVNGYICQRPV